MTKVLLFDFWGTLVENGTPSPTKQVQQALHIYMPFSSYITTMEQTMMTTKFENVRDAFIAIANTFRVHPRQEAIEHLIGVWNKLWMLAQPYEEIEELLATLQKKYCLILISNTDCFSVPKVIEKHDLQKYFEKIFLSYEIGMIKTDPKFLEKVLHELNVTVDNCIFIGDSLQSDMAVAKRIGMKHILMDRKNTRDFQPKITSLRELEQQMEHLQ